MKERLLILVKKLISVKGLVLIFSTVVFMCSDKIPLEAWIGIIGFVLANRTVEKVVVNK